jgi:hypothetical protein
MSGHAPDEIRYEAQPGFRRAFHRVLAAAVLYLAFIFFRACG